MGNHHFQLHTPCHMDTIYNHLDFVRKICSQLQHMELHFQQFYIVHLNQQLVHKVQMMSNIVHQHILNLENLIHKLVDFYELVHRDLECQFYITIDQNHWIQLHFQFDFPFGFQFVIQFENQFDYLFGILFGIQFDWL